MSSWSSKSFGSNIKYGFFRLLIKSRLSWLARWLLIPIPLYYSLRPSTAARARPYIARRFPGSAALESRFHTFRLYYKLANVLFDRLVLASGQRIPIVHDQSAYALFKEALNKGKGCIVVGAHFGCWQTGLAGLADLGVPLGVVFWQEEVLDQKFFAYEKDLTVIAADGGLESAIAMRSILRKNGIVCIMGDRVTPADRDTVKVSFLGADIELPLFPYKLAKITGSAVIHAVSVRKKGAICGLPAVLNAAAKPAAAYAEFLEELVLKYPHEFFNFYDMWLNDNDKS